MPYAVVSRAVVCLLIALMLVGLAPVPPPAPPEEARDSPAGFAALAAVYVVLGGATLVAAATSSTGGASETTTGSEGGTDTGAGGEGTDPDADTDTQASQSSAPETTTVLVPIGAEEGVLLTRDDTGPWYRFSHTGQATASATSAQVTYETIGAEADVLRTDEDVSQVSYVQEQTHTYRVERMRRHGEAKAQVSLSIDEVQLSTKDIPGTDGYSMLTMTVTVAGREVYSATASVAQAQEPVVSKDFSYKSIEAQKDLLILRGVEQTLDLKLPNRRTFDVAVTFRLEGVGQRL